jgi:hypothetical protein
MYRPTAMLTGVAFSPLGKTLATGSYDRKVAGDTGSTDVRFTRQAQITAIGAGISSLLINTVPEPTTPATLLTGVLMMLAHRRTDFS